MVVNIPQFPELTFNEFNHTYRLDELIIPSVTTLMKPLSDDVYRTVDPEVLEKAARRGTAIHNAVENFAKFGIEDIPPAYGGYFQAFRTWWELRQPEVLATECRVYHKVLRYAGTADLICVIGGRVTLVPGVLHAEREGAGDLQRGFLQRVQQGSSQLEVEAGHDD